MKRFDYTFSRTAGWIFLFCVSAFAAGCGASAESGSKDKTAREKTAVVETKIVTATAREIPAFIEATGTFQADESTDVAPQIAGQVIETPIGEGAFVRTGDIILRLDAREAQLKLEQTRAAESQTAAAVTQAEANFRQSQAVLGLDNGGSFSAESIPAVREARAALRSAESDLKLAEATERRYTNLLATGDTSKLVVDQRRNETEKARAAVGEARERLKNAENSARGGNQGIRSARANVENAQAALAGAKNNVRLAEKTLADTIIRAPFAGFVSSRPVAVGEAVSPSAPVITIVRANPIKLRLPIAETEAAKIKVGMSVSVKTAAQIDLNFAGRVTAINPSLDEQARRLLVEAVFENSENLLRPGMFATARLLLPTSEKAIYVPQTAVTAGQNTESASVFVIENDAARLRVVQIEANTPAENGEVRILSGLAEGEQIADGNLNALYDGARIQAGN